MDAVIRVSGGAQSSSESIHRSPVRNERSLSTRNNLQDDLAQRPFRDLLRAPALLRWIDSPIVLTASWAVSGALFGLGSALILQWSLPAAILAAAIAAALSWLGRGVANLLLACIVMLALIAIVLQAANYVSPGVSWSLSWLEPCAFGGVVVLLWLHRRMAPRAGFSRIGALVEFVAALAMLLIALRFVMRVSAAGTDGAGLFLVGGQDNDAWINLAAMHGANGATVLTGSSTSTFGPVIASYLAAVRAACSGVFPSALPVSTSSRVVVSAYGLLIATSPIVAALLVRRMLHLRRPIATLLVWAGASTLIVSSCIVWMGHGSLSSSLAVPLTLVAVYLAGRRISLENARGRVAWLAATSVLFAAGTAWIAFVPLGEAAIAVCCLPVLGFVARGFRDYRRIAVAAVLLAVAFVLEFELRLQYRDVVGATGVKALFLAPAGTPAVTGVMQVLMLVLLLAIAWLASRTHRGAAAPRSYLISLVMIVGYVIVLLLATAKTTSLPAGYGPTKLYYMLAAVWIPLAVIEVVSRFEIGRRQLNVAAVIVFAALWAGTVEIGPIYDAATRHWPTASSKPIWYDTVMRTVDLPERVFCLSLEQTTPGQLPLGAQDYFCSRFVSAVQGRDDRSASSWRYVSRGSLPVSVAVETVKSAKDKPWRIIVIGNMRQLRDPKAWWAPIVKLPGLEFVHVPGSG